MILVNDPGNWDAVYSPLEHAEWNGWTPTDLVFPFFLFLVGVAMVFSFSSRQEKGSTRRELLRHTIRRSLYIYGIGLALHLIHSRFVASSTCASWECSVASLSATSLRH